MSETMEREEVMNTPMVKLDAEDGIPNDQIYKEDSALIPAICAVMGDLKKLSQTAVNKHANYKYASIDDFLDTVRPLFAKHGLWVQQNEVSQEVRQGVTADGKTTAWLFMEFDFFLRCGTEVIGPSRRTAMVNAKMGAQAFGACQSYALKQYLRATFMIATGETNLDEGVLEHGDLPPKNSRDVRWQGPLTKTKLREMMKTYVAAVENAETLEGLEALGDGIAIGADDLPDDPRWVGGMTFSEVVEQCQHDEPGYLTGVGMPELFRSFNDRMAEALDRLGANNGK